MYDEFLLGAQYTPRATAFRVWAPYCEEVEVRLLDARRYVRLQPEAGGYFSGIVEGVAPDERYFYRLDSEKERPDPASQSQPDGVHGPSQVVDQSFAWRHPVCAPLSLRNSVFYELHVGAYTPDGTFDAVIPHLPGLADLGVTALQIMPVAQFPGARNWGYDGVQLFAPHSAYGGVNGLKRLVDAAHGHGLAVMLDVVYNHLGPEGNYLWDYGPYFTDRYKSPWGAGINLDGPDSDPVRRFFMANAVYWLSRYHFDGLRLDATHELLSFSARPFLGELTAQIADWAARDNRHVHIIAENDQSNRLLTLSRDANGLGLDGQWLDDFHHVLHVALTGESDGYYIDYQDFTLLPKVLGERFAYTGAYSPIRRRQHGTWAGDVPADRFVASTQTHDQVGNRMLGERLSTLTDFDGLKLAAGLLLTSPFTPMLFMGEEYGETAPFLFFTSHGDADLIEGVRRGRAQEFAAFDWRGEPPDPQGEETFARSKLNHALANQGTHALLYALYKELLAMRRAYPALTNPGPDDTLVYHHGKNRMICVERRFGRQTLRVFLNFELTHTVGLDVPGGDVAWRRVLDSRDARWSPKADPDLSPPATIGAAESYTVSLAPKAFAVYLQEDELYDR